MAFAPFVHLRVQSSYSMLEGAVQPAELVKRVAKARMPAMALVDRNNLFGAMEFSDYAFGAGVQPIIGVTIAVERPGPRGPLAKRVDDWLVVLAQDEAGYANLIELVSKAHLEAEGAPALRLADFEGHTDGLIALTAGPEGALARLLAEGQDANAYADTLQSLFGDRLYVEVSRTDDPIERKSEAGLIALAHARDLPLVATNPVRFAESKGHAAHDVLLCIAEGAYVDTQERNRSNPHHWLKSPSEMAVRFADLPEACANTLVVAQRCAVKAPSRAPILPSLAGDPEAEGRALAADAAAGLEDRLARLGVTGDARKVYDERLAFEIGVINTMGFAGYFLIVADFIKWAKAADIPVGPGRGSGAGSLVAWSLTITDLDPIEQGLLFERFLNPERVSMPDFDIDFCETRRDEVIRYVQQRYGSAQVAQIITFGRLKARAVLKDVGRVLQMPYGQVDRLAKLVPNLPADPWTLERALNGISEMVAERERDPKVAHLLEIALQLEGLPRHSSTHAAGVVIGDRPLSQLVPMYRDPRSDMGVTQFDMKFVEKAGLVKFDFLGLKTLSVLDRAVKLLKRRGIELDLTTLPWDDEPSYQLMARGDTVGVFQLESEGMRRTLAQVRPDRFGDIVALVALYRPGPMDNIPQFARRKNGEEAPDYLHPSLEELLKETYGVIIYQEQVMRIAQILAGYSLGEADLLRRAMGKKIQAEMDAQKARFLEGAKANDVDAKQASGIFDLVNKFAGYGFNKSHAAAYALIAYQTAFLKAHHPTEFFAASMAYDISNTDKLAQFVDDMTRSGVKCLPPCINASSADFAVEIHDGKPAVRFALAALKGVGEKAMESIVAERTAKGPFTSLADFARRIDPKLLNKRQLESLIGAGAFDSLDTNRAGVFVLAEALLNTAQAAAAARASAQVALFGDGENALADRSTAMLVPPGKNWTLAERMAAEKDAFGFYFSGHPVDSWRHITEANGAKTYAAHAASEGPPGGGRLPGVLAGLIEAVQWRTPQSGKGGRYQLVTLSDSSGVYTASCFDESAQAGVDLALAAGDAVLIGGDLQWRPGEDTPRVSIRSVQPLEQLAKRTRSRLIVDVDGARTACAAAIEDLAALLLPSLGGRGEVILRMKLADGRIAAVSLGREYSIDGELRGSVERVAGVNSVELRAVSA
ncbi:DNA polymerase III subunit alpha [Polymorphobacter arshaanensis]|uniref:DNA polymerase III subunit alpha n=1 Tax=Glacieibacterium arshaanense TaxID=2511025 RepID=A0A4Y9ERG3_9SPHN|nr:DNA polymerase III subunit alpha [Polymorphobacter arshaanensis]TFU06237.1 DNA polymerase III subunit alpha [Polymorphobacter arshaanensis]